MNEGEFKDAFVTVTTSVVKLLGELKRLDANYHDPKMLSTAFMALAAGCIRESYYGEDSERYWDDETDFEDVIELYTDDLRERLRTLKDIKELELINLWQN